MLDIYATHKGSFTISIDSTVAGKNIGIELMKLDMSKNDELENLIVESVENVVRDFLKKEQKNAL